MDFVIFVIWIDIFVQDGNVVVEIWFEGNYDYIVYQFGSEFMVSVEQLMEQEVEFCCEEKFFYIGEKLLFNF